MKIGVFDSGKGGMFVAENLKKMVPHCTYVVVNDSANVPYGSRTEHEVIRLTDRAIQPLLDNCPIIIIACNTATAAGVEILRQRYPTTIFIGLEPMLKPAQSCTRTGRITVLATPATLQSQRYRELKQRFGGTSVIDEPDTHDWARKIEDSLTHEIDLSLVHASVARGSDTVVLACTHYIGIKDYLLQTYPTVSILEPSEAIARRLMELLEKR